MIPISRPKKVPDHASEALPPRRDIAKLREAEVLLGEGNKVPEVVKALGGHMWDDDGKTWIIAVEDGGAAAFIGAMPEKGRVKAQSCYAVPGRENLIPSLIEDAAGAMGEPRDL